MCSMDFGDLVGFHHNTYSWLIPVRPCWVAQSLKFEPNATKIPYIPMVSFGTGSVTNIPFSPRDIGESLPIVKSLSERLLRNHFLVIIETWLDSVPRTPLE